MQEISFRVLSERSEDSANTASGRQMDGVGQQSLFRRMESSQGQTQPGFSDESIAGLRNVVFVRFFADVVRYLVSVFFRAGVWFGLAVDRIGITSFKLKRILLRQLFWRRGSTFQFTLQWMVLLMCGFIGLTFIYKGNGGVVVDDTVAYADFSSGQVAGAQTDLFIQGTTTTTAKARSLGVQFTDYIVKRGDTVSSIADHFDISDETLRWANNLKSDLIKPGMKLKIPPGDGLMVTVEKGDTVDTLAERYKGHAESIIEANVLDYPFTLHEGQELFCPECVPPPPPTTVVAQNTVRNYGTPTIYTQPRIPTATTVPAAAGAAGRFLSWPVQNGGAVSRCYTGYHPAIDIADRNLPNLVAAADGTVVFAGCQSGSCPALAPGVLARGGVGLAWMVEIQHDNGYRTAYAHMNRIDVTTGQRVSRGQVIGQLGSSGYSTGPHLHFVLLAPGVTNLLGGINPAPYMQQTGGCY